MARSLGSRITPFSGIEARSLDRVSPGVSADRAGAARSPSSPPSHRRAGAAAIIGFAVTGLGCAGIDTVAATASGG